MTHPFKLSENPSWHERYFYWYFSSGELLELPVKGILLVPTLLLILALGVTGVMDP